MQNGILSNARHVLQMKPSVGTCGGADQLHNAVNRLQSLLYAA
jgi:hypothetical protein